MRRALTATLMCLLASGATAQDATTSGEQEPPPPETSLTPEPRPEDLATPAPGSEADGAAPRTGASEDEDPGVPEQGGNEVTVVDEAPPVPERLAEAPEALAACHRDLRALGATFEIADAIAESGDAECGIVNPVQLSGLPGGVEVRPAGAMRCDTALALARWTTDHVAPAAAHLPERGALSAITQGSTYVCRRRNNLPEGKLSEHAFGNAVDIMAFHFETGPSIPVEPREREGTMAEAFQDAARATACLYFTTVLGPGSDASHDNHLHLDVKSRRGGFRLCQ